jgi:hypothetical protein
MHLRSAANFLKWFTWRMFCMVVLRFSAGKKPVSVERSAPSEASTAASRVRRSFPGHSAPCATAIYQNNVIRTHIRQRDALFAKGPPPSWPPPQSTGNAHAIIEERNVVAKNSRLLLGQEFPSLATKEIGGEVRLRQWRHRRCQAARTFRGIKKTGNRRGFLTSYLCRELVL